MTIQKPTTELRGFKPKDMSAPVEKKLGFYKLHAQMLEQGRTNTRLARGDNMWAVLKVYASGGENGLHCHPTEDHTFLILQGRARYHDDQGNATEVGVHEGVMVPAGSYYWFESIADEELVLFRVGSGTAPNADPSYRLNILGERVEGDSEENKQVPVKFKEGVFFE